MLKTSLLRSSVFAIVLPLVLAVATDIALAGCKSGYVWRDAKDGDGVCVTPEERAEAKAQNANAANNRRAGGGNTCRDGYVWREAFVGDAVCVTPHERRTARNQNSASASHSN
jgi:hypothetical protein